MDRRTFLFTMLKATVFFYVMLFPLLYAKSDSDYDFMATDDVQRLNYGVIFEKVAVIEASASSWSLTIAVPWLDIHEIVKVTSTFQHKQVCLLNITDAMCDEFSASIKTLNYRIKYKLKELRHYLNELDRLSSFKYGNKGFDNGYNSERKTRSILPIIGQISKTLFGTATTKDVSILARHISSVEQELANQRTGLRHFSADLSSVLKITNRRIDNLWSSVNNTFSTVEQLTLAVADIERLRLQTQRQDHSYHLSNDQFHRYMLLLNALDDRSRTLDVLIAKATERLIGMQTLLEGYLPPEFVSSKLLENSLQKLQDNFQKKYSQYHLCHETASYYHRQKGATFYRNGHNIYINIPVPLCRHSLIFDVFKPRGILERLDNGEVVVGDGGFVFALEKRGYVKAGPWTPEATVENPEAVLQLHREFLRAGSDVMQTFTFYGSDDKLENRGNIDTERMSGGAVNNYACLIAREVASEGGALVAGGVSQTPAYLSGKGKELTQVEFRKQMDVFISNDVDFVIAEYFEHVEEAEWAIEVCKESGKPVACSLCIGPDGDLHGVSTGECAVRMAQAGADIVGVNCHFGPTESLAAILKMRDALRETGLKPHLMIQPLGYRTPDASRQGFIDLPEFPFALEPRVCTRWEIQDYARQAYCMGVRYIGGCCGFEPYHIRAISEELAPERGFLPEGSKKHGQWGDGLRIHTKPWVRARARRSYWENLNPGSGRPYSASLSKPDSWGVTAGSRDLVQQSEKTTDEQLKPLFQHADEQNHQY
ncbi:betaine--homocysteine S-methyltransferase 1-like [Glandiceps talaboti]